MIAQRALWGSLALICTSSVLPAQEVKEKAIELPPVIVTATRLPTARAAVAATVSVLDGEDLRKRGVRYVSDALREVPGFHVVQTGSFGGNTALFVRGGESDYVKVLVDGVPINAPGGSFDLANLTTDNVERIEIVRGPVSVLYGSDAVAAVIQIFTRPGKGASRGELEFSAGTYSSLALDASLSGGGDVVSYAVAVSRDRTDGIYDFNSDYRNTVWSAQLRATPDERTEAKVSLRYSDSEFHFPTDFTGAPVDSNALRLQDQVVAAIEVGRFLSDRIEGRVLLALNEVDAANDDQPDGPADTLGFYGSKDLQAVVRRSVDGRINVYATSTVVLTGGVHIERQEERRFHESQSQFGTSSGSSEAARLNRAYYAQLHAEPLAGLALTIGGRLDDNEAFGTFLTGRGGVTYRFGTGLRVRASVGTAFKEPTFFENFSQNPFARGNPDLDPERSTSWEIGLEQEAHNGIFWLGVTYFGQRFRDLVQYTATPPNAEDPNFFNIAQANATGFEAEARVNVVAGLSMGAGYTYLRTRVVDAGYDSGPGAAFVEGERLLRRPTHAFHASARYRLLNRGSLAANVNVIGGRDDRDFTTFPVTPVVLERYTTVDIAAEFAVLRGAAGTPTVSVTLRVANLLDETYKPVFGFRAPGRTVSLGGKIGF